MKAYADAAALRRSLEARLKARSQQAGLPLDRLRKEDAAETDLGDHFEFLIGQGRRIQAEGSEGGSRFPVRCLLASRPFETLRLDVNLVTGDPRPLDHVRLRNLSDFADIPPVVVPAVRVEQQLAEKIHAYTRDYGEQGNSRAKDLYDLIAIAQHLRLPPLSQLRQACQETFKMRETDWPPHAEPATEDLGGSLARLRTRLRTCAPVAGGRLRSHPTVLGTRARHNTQG